MSSEGTTEIEEYWLSKHIVKILIGLIVAALIGSYVVIDKYTDNFSGVYAIDQATPCVRIVACSLLGNSNSDRARIRGNRWAIHRNGKRQY